MKRALLFLSILVLSITFASAQDTFPRHLWRAGWGDMAYEKAAFYDNASNFNYKYTGHFFAEYQYGILPWLGAGLKFDWSNVRWDTRQGTSERFNNFCIIPEVRFTYMRSGLFTLYSGLGVGLLINGGTETDYLGRRTVTAPVIDLTAVACSVQWGTKETSHWFTTVDLGGLISLNNKREVFMLNSRIVAISIGYRL